MIRAFPPVPRHDQRFGSYLHTELVLSTEISRAELYVCIQVGLKGDDEFHLHTRSWMAKIRPLQQ